MTAQTPGAADVLEGLRRRWPLALLVALPLFAAVVAYAESLPDEYEATSVVALTPRAEVGGDILRVTAPKYVAFLDSLPVRQDVADEVGVDEQDLDVNVSVAPETANLQVDVEMGSPQQAADIAQALAERAVRLAAGDRLLTADVLVPAVPVQEPSGPPRRLLEAGGLLLALLAGVLVALVADRSQPRVSTTTALQAVTGLRTLAAVPRSRRLRGPASEAMQDPAVSAAIGTLLVQLDTESRLQEVRLLAVTSPSPGDGKTTIATTLAAGLARLEARVLLVDSDLRKPRVAAALGIDDAGPGLGEVLEGTARLQDAVRQHGPGTLSVLTARPHADASNLLARRLRAVLSEAADYDVVVLDCPPVLATDDALVVAVTCDAALLVVDRGSRSSAAESAATTLHGLKVRVIGTVLNRARRGGGGAQAYGSYGRR